MSLDASGYDDHNIQAVLGSNFQRLLGSLWMQTTIKKGEGS
jgi:hypothetical protein